MVLLHSKVLCSSQNRMNYIMQQCAKNFSNRILGEKSQKVSYDMIPFYKLKIKQKYVHQRNTCGHIKMYKRKARD